MKLSEIRPFTEAMNSDLLANAAVLLAKKFGISHGDATDTVDFAMKGTDWEELSDEVREKLYSFYERAAPSGFDKANNIDPTKFIRPELLALLDLST